MSLDGLQNYTQPLSLLGDVTVKGDLNAKNIYVDGVLTGGGISTNILGTDNIWTGTNQYNDTTTYTGSNPVVNADDLTTKKDVDDLATSYNSGALKPTLTNNVWSASTTWSNITPPVVPSSTPINTKLVGYTEMNNYVNSYATIPASSSNNFTGNNQFTLNPQVSSIPSLLIPTQNNQLATKVYVDSKIEVTGKTLTYTVTNPGTYTFSTINFANVIGIEFMLFGGSYSGIYSGSMWSGKIGNANGIFNTLTLTVGIKNDTKIYTSYNSSIASNTTLKVGNEYVGVAGGACLLNSTPVKGQVIFPPNGLSGTLSCNGNVSADNLCKYSNILGTLTSAGGALLVAYYI